MTDKAGEALQAFQLKSVVVGNAEVKARISELEAELAAEKAKVEQLEDQVKQLRGALERLMSDVSHNNWDLGYAEAALAATEPKEESEL